MAKTALVDADIEAGKALLHLLDENQITITSALWMFYGEENEWRLLLASPLVEKQGSRKLYLNIRNVLVHSNWNWPNLQLENISVISNKKILIKSLKRAIRTTMQPSTIRFSDSKIDNLYIEDALIYRST